MTEKEFSLDDVYVSFDLDSSCLNLPKENDDILKKSIISQCFANMKVLPGFEKKKKKTESELPEEVLNDLQILKMRSVLDPKHKYKSKATMKISKNVQIGHVLDSPFDFYSSRLPKKMRKRTLVDELLADDEFKKGIKKRYAKIIEDRQHQHRFKKKYKSLKYEQKRNNMSNKNDA